ncbi:MAG: MmcQ/YjbR family DNA-binding protein [Sphaerochaetaceae bacterium]|nr:MmcQ/YjbR family DNA-binding protein [Sphaerochaetaceae bacterium]
MSIESEVFSHMRFVPSRLTEYGFYNDDGKMVIRKPFMDGDFTAEITVFPDGSVKGTVIDVMNDEPYAQLRMEDFNGPYVNTVRSAYRDLLSDIGKACCTEVLFVCDQANRIVTLIDRKYGVKPDFPWESDPYQAYGVFRHRESRKWFALMMDVKWKSLLKNRDESLITVVNLKIREGDGEKLRSENGIFEGYHMNHRLWISVLMDSTVPDERVLELIENSFNLTYKA